MGNILPKYPVYIPTKGRADYCHTAQRLSKDGVPFRLVVQEPEQKIYAARFGSANILVLPFQAKKGLVPARNWIKAHAIAEGHERPWQFDDNIRMVRRWYKGKRLPCKAGIALRVVEDFADRYENVAIAGLNYTMFGLGKLPPFHLNARVYSCSLILNSIPHRWRGHYNDDTDLCLQVLADGWCTVLVNVFLVDKITTMKIKGGNTDALYQADGRLKMARSLERVWPGVVRTNRRFKRPQHVVFDAWRRFDNPLKRKPGVVISSGPNEYGMELKRVGVGRQSDALKRMLDVPVRVDSVLDRLLE